MGHWLLTGPLAQRTASRRSVRYRGNRVRKNFSGVVFRRKGSSRSGVEQSHALGVIVQNLRRSREFPFLLVKVNRFTNYTPLVSNNNK